ncbi:LysE family transporter [Streptomyces sp900105245]|uniref:LysE family translocator n=1 Tax=Streptomyces sp. 900105245 TaxID=3154379 RepID=UPI00332457F4
MRPSGSWAPATWGSWAPRRCGSTGAPHPPPPRTGPAAVAGPWRTGLVSNLLNPKIAVFHTGLLPAPAPPGLPPAWAMTLLVLLHTALTLAWLGGYVLLLSRAGPVLHQPRIRRALGRTTGVTLIGFCLLLATAGT